MIDLRSCAIVLGLAVVLGCLLGSPSSARASEPDAPSVRRFALLVGANDGGGERELLRYADSDAEMFGKALVELGGLGKDDRVVLRDPSVAALEQGFDQIRSAIRRANTSGERIQFVFYYSGHSDESGLLLGGVRVDYKRLRQLIEQVPADVRIGILDSCSSGAFTRFKGGKKRAPFLVGTAAEVEGHAYLTSSSADEAAQESDRIGGSFFTHFLVTGLRGAADFDGDRRVTLNEAYRFAFDETLARTETTSGGPQHAAYDIDLAGSGDLVMTDLRKTSAKLEIAGAVAGRIYVRDRRGNLAAELFKPKGAGAVTLALEPGNYSVTLDDGRNLHRADVEVRSNKTELLKLDALEGIPLEGTRLRGGDVDHSDRPEPPLGGYVRVPFNIGVTPNAELNASFTRAGGRDRVLDNFSISFGATKAAALEGVQLGLGAVWTTDYTNGVQAAFGASLSRGPMVGVQTAFGLARTRADFRGVQAAGVSLGHERVTGVQLGYGLGWARQLRGIQLGALSVAGDARGLQAGLISVTRNEVKGLQVGLVTYAEEADAAIAIVPVTKKGGVWFDLWTSDVQLLHVSAKFRARKTYAFLAVGLHPMGDNSRSFSAAFGFGGPLVWRRRFSVELDNAIAAVNPGLTVDRTPYLVDTLRLSLAWRPARHFALWAAVTGNAMIDLENSGSPFRPGYGWAYDADGMDVLPIGLKLWPGFAVGFEF